MASFVILALVISGLLLILSSSSVLLLLWTNARQDVYLYCSALVLGVIIWLFGSMTARTFSAGVGTIEVGFALTTIVAYLLSARLTDLYGASTRGTVLVGITVIVITRVLAALLLDMDNPMDEASQGLLTYYFPRIDSLLYLLMSAATLIIVRQNRDKVDHRGLVNGLSLMAAGLSLTLLIPQMRTYAISEILAAISAFMISYAFLQRDIMSPLRGRTKQLEVIRDVGLAITSRVHSGDVLDAVAGQAAELLQSDGSAIYLKRDDILTLEAVHAIPRQFLGFELPMGEGLAGVIAATSKARRIDNYRREWKGKPDMPHAHQSFGSVLGAPLIFREEVMGVLLVINGVRGLSFDEQDLHIMSLIAPQAAVSISNSRLFEQERSLKNEVSAAKQQLEAFLTSTENPVIALDQRLNILFINPAAAALIDQTADSLQGQSLVDLIDREILPDRSEMAYDLRQYQSHAYDISFNGNDYLCHIARLKPPIRGWVIVLNDITKLKEIDRLKSQMVRMTSHDLKNPLFSVMTYMELLQEDGETLFDDDMRHYMSAIWKQLTRMERIVKGILDLERVQSGATMMAPTDVRQLLLQVTNNMLDQAATRQIYFHQEISDNLLEVLGDDHQLEQVISNLVDNALKYTPAGGTVWLRARNQDSAIIIEVEDNGFGIPRDVQNLVFDRFFRVKTVDTATVAGTGIGLSLVKAIIDQHKGRVWLKSEEGAGTTFYVTLPAIPEPVI